MALCRVLHISPFVTCCVHKKKQSHFRGKYKLGYEIIKLCLSGTILKNGNVKENQNINVGWKP